MRGQLALGLVGGTLEVLDIHDPAFDLMQLVLDLGDWSVP
jgi:hypothetical protein